MNTYVHYTCKYSTHMYAHACIHACLCEGQSFGHPACCTVLKTGRLQPPTLEHSFLRVASTQGFLSERSHRCVLPCPGAGYWANQLGTWLSFHSGFRADFREQSMFSKSVFYCRFSLLSRAPTLLCIYPRRNNGDGEAELWERLPPTEYKTGWLRSAPLSCA